MELPEGAPRSLKGFVNTYMNDAMMLDPSNPKSFENALKAYEGDEGGKPTYDQELVKYLQNVVTTMRARDRRGERTQGGGAKKRGKSSEPEPIPKGISPMVKALQKFGLPTSPVNFEDMNVAARVGNWLGIMDAKLNPSLGLGASTIGDLVNKMYHFQKQRDQVPFAEELPNEAQLNQNADPIGQMKRGEAEPGRGMPVSSIAGPLAAGGIEGPMVVRAIGGPVSIQPVSVANAREARRLASAAGEIAAVDRSPLGEFEAGFKRTISKASRDQIYNEIYPALKEIIKSGVINSQGRDFPIKEAETRIFNRIFKYAESQANPSAAPAEVRKAKKRSGDDTSEEEPAKDSRPLPPAGGKEEARLRAQAYKRKLELEENMRLAKEKEAAKVVQAVMEETEPIAAVGGVTLPVVAVPSTMSLRGGGKGKAKAKAKPKAPKKKDGMDLRRRPGGKGKAKAKAAPKPKAPSKDERALLNVMMGGEPKEDEEKKKNLYPLTQHHELEWYREPGHHEINPPVWVPTPGERREDYVRRFMGQGADRRISTPGQLAAYQKNWGHPYSGWPGQSNPPTWNPTDKQGANYQKWHGINWRDYKDLVSAGIKPELYGGPAKAGPSMYQRWK